MSNDLHVVVGAGPVGSAVAEILAEQGHRVRVVTRSGSGPESPQVERVRADAADAARLGELAAGSVALYNCVNPPYNRWSQDWPPVAQALLAAAESSGAVLAMTDNLYAYGPVTAPMTEQTPLAGSYPKAMVRKQMWLDGLAAHEAGRIRVHRAPAAPTTWARRRRATSATGSSRACSPARTSRCSTARTPRTPGRTPATWRARSWRSPPTSGPGAAPGTCPRTRRAPSARRSATWPRIAGVEPVKVSTVPAFVLRAMGLFSPVGPRAAGCGVPDERAVRDGQHGRADRAGPGPDPVGRRADRARGLVPDARRSGFPLVPR